LHVASAIEGKADYFLTTDDKLLSYATRSNMIKALNPVDYVKVLEE
jgi:predicted nucleic acid-binding protein